MRQGRQAGQEGCSLMWKNGMEERREGLKAERAEKGSNRLYMNNSREAQGLEIDLEHSLDC